MPSWERAWAEGLIFIKIPLSLLVVPHSGVEIHLYPELPDLSGDLGDGHARGMNGHNRDHLAGPCPQGISFVFTEFFTFRFIQQKSFHDFPSLLWFSINGSDPGVTKLV